MMTDALCAGQGPSCPSCAAPLEIRPTYHQRRRGFFPEDGDGGQPAMCWKYCNKDKSGTAHEQERWLREHGINATQYYSADYFCYSDMRGCRLPGMFELQTARSCDSRAFLSMALANRAADPGIVAVNLDCEKEWTSVAVRGAGWYSSEEAYALLRTQYPRFKILTGALLIGVRDIDVVAAHLRRFDGLVGFARCWRPTRLPTDALDTIALADLVNLPLAFSPQVMSGSTVAPANELAECLQVCGYADCVLFYPGDDPWFLANSPDDPQYAKIVAALEVWKARSRFVPRRTRLSVPYNLYIYGQDHEKILSQDKIRKWLCLIAWQAGYLPTYRKPGGEIVGAPDEAWLALATREMKEAAWWHNSWDAEANDPTVRARYLAMSAAAAEQLKLAIGR